jgi:hypothetical protein
MIKFCNAEDAKTSKILSTFNNIMTEDKFQVHNSTNEDKTFFYITFSVDNLDDVIAKLNVDNNTCITNTNG